MVFRVVNKGQFRMVISVVKKTLVLEVIMVLKRGSFGW